MVVTESKMLVDRVTREEREVDIAVEFTAGAVPFILGIECVARSRRPTVDWVLLQIKRHEHLTDKLVLVANRPFSRRAAEVAALHRVETIALSEAVSTEWAEYLTKEANLGFSVFDVEIKTFELKCVRRTGSEPPDVASPARLLGENGTSAPLDVALSQLIAKGDVVPKIMTRWAQTPKGERKYEYEQQFTYTLLPGRELVLVQGASSYRVFEIKGLLKVVVGDSSLRLAPTDYKDVSVVYGTAIPDRGSLAGQTARIVLSKRPGEVPAGTIMVDDLANGTRIIRAAIFPSKTGGKSS